MNLTYFIGAGASANALPVVRNMNQHIMIFILHFKNTGLLTDQEISYLYNIYNEIEKHYTIDTYAKKLFLKGKEGENDLFKLCNFIGAFFIYEQLRKDKNEDFCKFLFYDIERHRSVINSIDYRYDSFFAALLKKDIEGKTYLPENINIISWNYDFQFEISFMNFLNQYGLDEIQNRLNVYPTPSGRELRSASSIIKINGTAGFYKGRKNYSDLFDFRHHSLDRSSMEILKEIIFQQKKTYESSIFFAWDQKEITIQTRDYARKIISDTDILVVIGYSFPYFNRDVDRGIFKEFHQRSRIVYIQTTEDTFQSVKNRAIGTSGMFNNAKPFTELDQFLIPNEM